MSSNERDCNYIILKEILENITPKLIEVHGKDILKMVTIQEHVIKISNELCDYERVFCTIKEELREKCGIEIGNNPTRWISLHFKKEEH